MKFRSHPFAYGVLALVILLLTIWVVFSVVQNNKNQAACAQGTALLAAGRYQEAVQILEPLEKDGFPAAQRLYRLSLAHLNYDEGELSQARDALSRLEAQGLPPTLQEEALAFIQQVELDYDQYLADQEAQQAQERYAQAAASEIPYVGMYEANIADTRLGSPSSEPRQYSAMVYGETRDVTVYTFLEDGKIVCMARCSLGCVDTVWDCRDNPATPADSRPRKLVEDEYDDVNSYSHAEDFYYYHYNDFSDYGEAEDYFKEHHGS